MTRFLEIHDCEVSCSREKSGKAIFSRPGIELSLSALPALFGPASPTIRSVASPLPGFSRESLAEVRQAAGDLESELFFACAEQPNWQAALQCFSDAFHEKDTLVPSLHFACECLILQLQAELQERTIGELFGVTIGDSLLSVPLLDWENRHSLFSREFGSQQTVKIKLPESPPSAMVFEELFSNSSPLLRFRFDANQCYSIELARSTLATLSRFADRIDFFEEPAHPGEMEYLTHLQEEFPNIAIAADESLRASDDFIYEQKEFLLSPLIWILKPSLGPSLSRCSQILAHRTNLGRRCILSSAGESLENFLCLLHFARAMMPRDERVGFGVYPFLASPREDEGTLVFRLS